MRPQVILEMMPFSKNLLLVLVSLISLTYANKSTKFNHLENKIFQFDSINVRDLLIYLFLTFLIHIYFLFFCYLER